MLMQHFMLLRKTRQRKDTHGRGNRRKSMARFRELAIGFAILLTGTILISCTNGAVDELMRAGELIEVI